MTEPKQSAHPEPRRVVVLSDDPAFARAVTARWQSERDVPAFTVAGGDAWRGLDTGACDLVILGGLPLPAASAALAVLNLLEQPVIFVADCGADAARVRGDFPRILVMAATDGWLDPLVLLALECLRRREASLRARRAEQQCAAFERDAVLGRYMIEMRHGLNNALTSVLGNSELVLLEPGMLSSEARLQVETIRNMAVRMNEILQRFTSLEKELTVLSRQAETVRARGQAAAN